VRVRATDGLGPRSAVDPTLADAIAALNDGGYWATAFDNRWRIVAQTAETERAFDNQWRVAALTGEAAPGHEAVGGPFHFGPDAFDLHGRHMVTTNTPEENREALRHLGGWILSDLAIDRSELRDLVHPALRDIVDELEPNESIAMCWDDRVSYFDASMVLTTVAQRVRDATGHIVGTVLLTTPAVAMNTIAMVTAASDVSHLQRMQQFAEPGQRPAAVLFADLEKSAQLSKQLPTAAYFALIRRMTRAADQCVIDGGGLVGRHVGDGVAAFFVAEVAGSESAAVRACIDAARAVQAAMSQIAERHELGPRELTLRAGLHWGATLYIGSIITLGRTEVTALGDEVNETARIEACAAGGRMLASKNLIERLNPSDAAALGIDPNHVTYTPLADLDTATDKARRDAPAVPVYDINVTR
jgi:class 3 adenylate cyclase